MVGYVSKHALLGNLQSPGCICHIKMNWLPIVNYEFTIDDPTTWVTAFSGEFPMRRLPGDELLYEYACHEGNYSMEGILGGERTLELAGKK